MIEYRTALGQDSHRFEQPSAADRHSKPLMLAGVFIPGIEGLDGNSDADVVFHALTNAISGISCVNILGTVSDRMCLEQNIKDSSVYLRAALETLQDNRLVHISISIECARPRITPYIERMRASLSDVTSLPENRIGITATSGEGLTGFGRGEGIQVFCIVTVMREYQQEDI